jgi:hypothetical protein
MCVQLTIGAAADDGLADGEAVEEAVEVDRVALEAR